LKLRAFVAFVVAVSIGASFDSSALAQTPSCADFDAWPWAQSVFEQNPDAYQATMDPDLDNIACPDLPITGFAPVGWTDGIPDSAVPAQVTSIIDGDTFDVSVTGAPDRVRMYHIDTPETTNFGGGPQCGGSEASDYLAWVLSLAPNNTVYLEYDQTQRDPFDRRLAYVWYELAGDVYMVNEIMVRNGWAESESYQPDVKYRDELNEAEQFSVQKVVGVRLQCGRFGQPVDAQPSQEQVAQARRFQPDQGQFAIFDATAPAHVQEPPASAPPVQPVQPSQPVQSGACDPSYPTVCIPPVGVQGDLDCGDISYRRFQVLPPDPHNFDGDFDGVGCESG
jgi:micrococcal nuclease